MSVRNRKQVLKETDRNCFTFQIPFTNLNIIRLTNLLGETGLLALQSRSNNVTLHVIRTFVQLKGPTSLGYKELGILSV